jgi:23S rRNA (cytosine1962-C5)-methyltransferase
MKNEIKIFCSKDWVDYELLDTGEGEKLEHFGKYIFIRPCENAFWPKCSTPSVEQNWKKADGKFWSSKQGAKPGWQMSKGTFDIKSKWEMEYKGIKFLAMPTPFRHLGFFPEQASHWDFIENAIRNSGRKIKFLNLFGYTGVASLFALRAGAEVTHVDASKQILNWAKENQKLNTELAEMPMRIIEDDVLKFLEREEKRGNKYDCVIMDPPKFGRGPKGEIWKLEENLPKLLSAVRKVLSAKPLFVILTSYAIDSSSLSLGYALEEMMKPARPPESGAGGDFKGRVEAGELCVLEKSNNRIIPLANTALWMVK